MAYLKAVLLTENEPVTCGNYVVDEMEKCDAGFAGRLGSDPCCDSSCQLRTGADCRWVELLKYWSENKVSFFLLRVGTSSNCACASY